MERGSDSVGPVAIKVAVAATIVKTLSSLEVRDRETRARISAAAWWALTGDTNADAGAIAVATVCFEKCKNELVQKCASDITQSDRVAALLNCGALIIHLFQKDSVTASALFSSVFRPLAGLVALGGRKTELTEWTEATNYSDTDENHWGRFEASITGLFDWVSPKRDQLLLEAFAGFRRIAPAAARVSLLVFEKVALIIVAAHGPYLLTGAEVTNHLGEVMEGCGPRALCRCGQSLIKPYCDGTHAITGFSDEKDPRRVADMRDTYYGQQVTIHDNRGLCAHSGFCTDRLKSVFHIDETPFVTPSGARLDDIHRAIRKCPSGALSMSFEGKEEPGEVSQSRPASIMVSQNGPYRIVGSIPLIDGDGNPVRRLTGASMEHYSLCRCGSSLNKPFCSGMHWSTQFIDPEIDPQHEPTLFEWAGGYPALLDLTTIFYSRHVPGDPLIGPLFARMAPDHPERVAAWLSEVFGGPKIYSDRYGGYERMISEHMNKNIRPEQRARWVELLTRSADEAGIPQDAEFRAAFSAYIEWGSRIALENSAKGAQPPPHMPVPRWWWVCNATPGSRVSETASETNEIKDYPLPEDKAEIVFETHIKPLFRPMDRNSMKFAFDLWSESDVRQHGHAILARLKSGTMPCDGAWPAAKVAIFEAWLSDRNPF